MRRNTADPVRYNILRTKMFATDVRIIGYCHYAKSFLPKGKTVFWNFRKTLIHKENEAENYNKNIPQFSGIFIFWNRKKTERVIFVIRFVAQNTFSSHVYVLSLLLIAERLCLLNLWLLCSFKLIITIHKLHFAIYFWRVIRLLFTKTKHLYAHPHRHALWLV